MKYRFLLNYVIYEKIGLPQMNAILFMKGETVELEEDTVFAGEDREEPQVIVRKEIENDRAILVHIPITVLMFAAERIKEKKSGLQKQRRSLQNSSTDRRGTRNKRAYTKGTACNNG